MAHAWGIKKGVSPKKQASRWSFTRNSPIEVPAYLIYFVAGAGATVSLCCVAQAPSPKAVNRTATIMIIFKNFIYIPSFPSRLLRSF